MSGQDITSHSLVALEGGVSMTILSPSLSNPMGPPT